MQLHCNMQNFYEDLFIEHIPNFWENNFSTNVPKHKQFLSQLFLI